MKIYWFLAPITIIAGFVLFIFCISSCEKYRATLENGDIIVCSLYAPNIFSRGGYFSGCGEKGNEIYPDLVNYKVEVIK